MVFDGMITGRNVLIIPNRLIVQTWRSRMWKRTDPDSLLILTFRKAPDGAEISLAHVNVPNHEHARFNEGWHKPYWKPWRSYLKRTSSQ